jgi:4-hydroxy-3-methylbut-2-enyl diphosphate reductase IspH
MKRATTILMKTSRKKLTIAAPRGFCAGVDRAVRIVEVALGKIRGTRLCTP